MDEKENINSDRVPISKVNLNSARDRTPTAIRATKNDTINDTMTSVQIMDNSTVKMNDFSSDGDVQSVEEQTLEMYSLSKQSSLDQTGNKT